jgi:hypothetical protein
MRGGDYAKAFGVAFVVALAIASTFDSLFGPTGFTLVVLAMALAPAVLWLRNVRAEQQAKQDRIAELIQKWWLVPLAWGLGAVFMNIIGSADKVRGLELLKGVFAGSTMAAFGTWFFIWRKNRQRVDPWKITVDASGLPVFTWGEDRRRGGVVNVLEAYRRHCRIERRPDGGFDFVHTSTRDESWKAAPLVGVLAKPAVAKARELLDSPDLLQQEFTQRRPWDELQGFVVTDDVAYLGVRTMGGERPRNPSPVIVADFGMVGGQIVVSQSEDTPNNVAQLHGALTVVFIQRRNDYLSAAAAKERRVRKDAAVPREKVV